ncbi:MAG: hypothetical protein ABI146_00915 [Nitrobacter sp.]
MSQGAVADRKAAIEPTDWPDLEEHRFARTVAAVMEQWSGRVREQPRSWSRRRERWLNFETQFVPM